MAAMTTTLPLFWNLASVKKSERLGASVELVSALQYFQDQFRSVQPENDPQDEGEWAGQESDLDFDACSAKLDAANAPDVAYAIRRLLRGLASPRESSRLGFAVALTELLSRIDTVTCQQVLVLLKSTSQTTGSMSGQEERDILFSRLFGLKAVIQSGLLFRHGPFSTSSTNSGSLKAFEIFFTELLSLGEKKSWLKESCWWTLISAIGALYASDVQWKDDALDLIMGRIFVEDKSWGPEKVAVALKMQKLCPKADWGAYCDSYFKTPDILAATNLQALARLLKNAVSEDSLADDTQKPTNEPWKPQLHFVWDSIFDVLLNGDAPAASGKFQDFYRIVVDESLFSSTSSVERKYWGFLVFQRALNRLPSAALPLLFTRNFMRTWINHLSKTDRYLHKIAQQVATSVHETVGKNPKAGFTLVLQLMGTNGSLHFDRITRTKTVEAILAKMDSGGIKEFITYLLKQVDNDEENESFSSVDTRRAWIIDQLTTLIRKNSIPKDIESIEMVLTWIATHAFFNVTKKSSKSPNPALHFVPNPSFTEGLRRQCREKLLACLADLLSAVNTVGSKDENEAKCAKAFGVAANGEFLVTHVLKAINRMEIDTKHVKRIFEISGERQELREEALLIAEKVKAQHNDHDQSRGVILLLHALVLKCICEDDENDWDALQDCKDISLKLFGPVEKDKTKSEKTKQQEISEEERPPIDIIVDIIIGLLEQSTSFTRTIANQSFSLMSPLITESTVDLILTQLEGQDPMTNEGVLDKEMEGSGEDVSEKEENDESVDKVKSPDNDEADEEEGFDDQEAEELRKALKNAMGDVHSMRGGLNEDESSDESMDDEQMMQIDEKLAEVFRSRTEDRKKGKDLGVQREATYFKNRVLDLVDIFMKKHASSNLVLLFVLPLVDLVSSASPDEKQLADKTKGILRSRLVKARGTAPSIDTKSATKVLQGLHERARRAHSTETTSLLSHCSIFVSRALLTSDEAAVLRIYGDSVADFITRKASGLNSAFMTDFVKRYPLHAWNLRGSVLESAGKAVNGYRQAQAFHITQVIVTGLPNPDTRKSDIVEFMPAVSDALLSAISSSCTSEKPLISIAQMKETLKLAHQLRRFEKRIVGNAFSLGDAWKPTSWAALVEKLAASEHFKASKSLATICRQIAQLTQAAPAATEKKEAVDNSEAAKLTAKRKEHDVASDVDNVATNPKRKRARKMKSKGPNIVN